MILGEMDDFTHVAQGLPKLCAFVMIFTGV